MAIAMYKCVFKFYFKSRLQNRCLCVDHTRPALAVDINKVRNSILDAKRRGVRIRCIIEIVKENLSSCKDLLNIVDELTY